MRNFKPKPGVMLALALALVAGMAGMASSASAQTIPGVSDAQIKEFFASNPNLDQVDAMAKSMGLNTTQYMQATAIGKGLDYSTMPQWQTTAYYGMARHATGGVTDPMAEAFGGNKTGTTYSPTLGREISGAETAAFYATNPSQAQIIAKAAELGLSPAAIPPNPFASQNGVDANFLSLAASLNTGANGYSMQSNGQIVSSSSAGAMYSSDPAHTGLDSYVNPGLAGVQVNNPAIPVKVWNNVNGR